MYGALLSLLGGMAQQPGQTQQSNMLDRRRQYFQQLLSGTTTPIGMGQRQIFSGQNDSDLFGLASLLGGQMGGQSGGMQKYNPPMGGNMGAFYGNYFGR